MKLRLYREKTGLSQIAAGEQLGVSKDVYNSWEYGHRIPRPGVMKKITQWSNGAVTPNDFYLDEGECDA